MSIKTFYIGLIIFVFICMSGIIYIGAQMYEKEKEIKKDCTQTNLYAIGNKGHRIIIYDCSKNIKK